MPCTAADAACTQPGSQLAAEQRLQQRGGCGQQRSETVRTLKVTSSAVQVVAVQALHEMPNMLHRGRQRGSTVSHSLLPTAACAGTAAAGPASGGCSKHIRHGVGSSLQLAACSLQLVAAPSHLPAAVERAPAAGIQRAAIHARQALGFRGVTLQADACKRRLHVKRAKVGAPPH